jgi:hypothetical protein
MTSSSQRSPRQLLPEVEVERSRSTELSYEPSTEVGLVRCLEHGFPTPLARWHCHEEYELHLIVATSGQAFVGDWIGAFEPGHLVLCGPKLPHNWISLDMPAEGVPQRDLVIQFLHDPICEAAQRIPELQEAVRMLERARYGILRDRHKFKVYKDRKFVASAHAKPLVDGVCSAANTKNLVYALA